MTVGVPAKAKCEACSKSIGLTKQAAKKVEAKVCPYCGKKKLKLVPNTGL